MSKPTTLKGRALIIKDKNDQPIDDIDTDMIFHNRHLHITELSQMGIHAFGNLEGWKDFPNIVKQGDILIVGKNFGAGSSRQQAVDCFRALGIVLIIGESFGAIYKRNTINTGLPLLIVPNIMEEDLVTGDIIEVNLETGEIMNDTKKIHLTPGTPLSKVQLDIYQAGSLFDYGKTL
ncbi:MAG: 3-isopropylmalate dehydratase [Candidatus Hodarchaeota archaeon]